MNGQWTGICGTGNEYITADIDDRGSYFSGTANYRTDDGRSPWLSVGFQTADKKSAFQLETANISVHDPANGDFTSWESIKDRFPEITIPKSIDLTGEWDEASLKLSWKSDLAAAPGTCTLAKSGAGEPSQLKPKTMGWADFKKVASGLSGRRDLFRGQSDQWRLRTTFHRNGRADLIRFLSDDIPSVYRHLTARTRHKFNLKDPDENGAFFNLLQHHGYPTPLLDWTYSPYVAAFFAYRGISRAEALRAQPDRSVRVFILDGRWKKNRIQINYAARPFPHFSIAEFIAIDNERMIPQQSVSAITNVDDIESYIEQEARTTGNPYLCAIDLPASERSTVFSDLAHMGVTAGSLFPGLDGTCEELKERHFL